MEEQPAVDGALSCELIEPAGLLAEIARPCANLSVRFVSVGVLAEVCISRVGCFGANGVGVHELWEYAGAMAGCGASHKHVAATVAVGIQATCSVRL